MSEVSPPPLDYAPATDRRSWRSLRPVLRWAGIVALFILALWYGPRAVRQAFYLRAQRHCLNFSLSPDQVVYSNVPGEVKALAANGYKPAPTFIDYPTGSQQGSTGQGVGFVLPPLNGVGEDTVARYAPGGGSLTRVPIPNAPSRIGGFLHVRKNAQVKENRLVAILFAERQHFSRANATTAPVKPLPPQVEVTALVWQPATWELGSRLELLGLTSLPLATVGENDIQIFAAQLDPNNSDHVTIPYAINGQRGTIDGHLDFLDRVELQVRDGPALLSPRAAQN
jgi:hypothetical protein